MSDKSNIKNIVKKENIVKQNDVGAIVDKKIEFFKDVVQKTILHVQKNKIFDILGISHLLLIKSVLIPFFHLYIYNNFRGLNKFL